MRPDGGAERMVQRLGVGQWPRTDGLDDVVITPEEWAKCLDEDSQISGALTMALLRAVGPQGRVTGYELRPDFAERAMLTHSQGKLAGIISVEGSRADVIIANPAGIQVNGGGFKNANRAVLTTGAFTRSDSLFTASVSPPAPARKPAAVQP